MIYEILLDCVRIVVSSLVQSPFMLPLIRQILGQARGSERCYIGRLDGFLQAVYLLRNSIQRYIHRFEESL